MLRRPVILATTASGGVTLTYPAPECVAWLSCGGFWGKVPRGWLEREIARHTLTGTPEWAAARFVRGLHDGGLTEAEAYGVIRDKDVRGTAAEMIDAASLPPRTYRDAWRRGHNGGPVTVDLTAARNIHWRKLQSVAREALTDFDAPQPRWGIIRDQIKACASVDALSRVGLDA